MKIDNWQSVEFPHSHNMLRHAFWLVVSWAMGRSYEIVNESALGDEDETM
jgi:hypothetical protein